MYYGIYENNINDIGDNILKVQQGSLTSNSQKNHLVIKLFLNYPDIFRLNGLDIVSATKITKTLKFNSQLEYKNIKI